MLIRAAAMSLMLGTCCLSTAVLAGPETSIRELGSGQIKKGVRSLGMGGDGATLGNYALTDRDAGTAILDYGQTRYQDTGSKFAFAALGATSPKFWGNTSLYLVGMSQQTRNANVWTKTGASAKKPPARGDGYSSGYFVKIGRPITDTVSIGVLINREVSDMTLTPKDGSGEIRYKTQWRPSAGIGVTWRPLPELLTGIRILSNQDHEIKTDRSGSRSAESRSREFRTGAMYQPWAGLYVDAGVIYAVRVNGLEGTTSYEADPVLGIEQEVVSERFWLRAGLDETSPTAGLSVKVAPFKLDLAYIRNLGHARIGDVFGKVSDSLVGTINLDYL